MYSGGGCWWDGKRTCQLEQSGIPHCTVSRRGTSAASLKMTPVLARAGVAGGHPAAPSSRDGRGGCRRRGGYCYFGRGRGRGRQQLLYRLHDEQEERLPRPREHLAPSHVSPVRQASQERQHGVPDLQAAN